MATAQTPLGEIKGTNFEGYERYAGIRYATARRFEAPEPIAAWEGVYDATTFGPSAPQPPPAAGAVGVQRELVISEDCLSINVFTPKADGGARPVMVWIHGGAYSIGSGDIYDGASFVTHGDVVVVTLNYRLGILGWTPLDHLDPSLVGAANNGVRDQIEALRWVRDNIAAFGGDPNNVTIFGESAGGGSVGALLCAPAADGLYHKAIMQSPGPAGFGALADPGEYANEILEKLGNPDGGIAALRAAAPEELAAAQVAVGLIERLGSDASQPIDGTGSGPHPSVDGVVITRALVEAIAEKAANNVPLIIGTNLDEGTLFSLALPKDLTDAQLHTAIGPNYDADAILATLKEANTGHPPIVDLMTDAVFRIPSLRAADAQAATSVPVWVYLFTWATPVFGGAFGSTHALEIPFVWDMFRDAGWNFLVGDNPPVAIAEAMQQAWLAFARTGDPNGGALPAWPSYETTTRPTMEFGDNVGVVHDPDSARREAWYR
jgi:para-nitrobenzyl esterase